MWSPDDALDRLALRLLDLLEEREYRLLVWGYLDGYFDKDTVEQLAQELIDDEDVWESPGDVVERLRGRALLFEFTQDGNPTYRTRFAEYLA